MEIELIQSITQQLIGYFQLSMDEGEQEILKGSLKFALKYMRQQDQEDLMPLLFIECVEESRHHKLTLESIKRIISRIQKRIQRESIRVLRPPLQKKNLYYSKKVLHSSTGDAQEAIVLRFITYLKDNLDLRNAIIFQQRFIEGISIKDICRKLGLGPSVVYESVAIIHQQFRKFLEDQAL